MGRNKKKKDIFEFFWITGNEVKVLGGERRSDDISGCMQEEGTILFQGYESERGCRTRSLFLEEDLERT